MQFRILILYWPGFIIKNTKTVFVHHSSRVDLDIMICCDDISPEEPSICPGSSTTLDEQWQECLNASRSGNAGTRDEQKEALRSAMKRGKNRTCASPLYRQPSKIGLQLAFLLTFYLSSGFSPTCESNTDRNWFKHQWPHSGTLCMPSDLIRIYPACYPACGRVNKSRRARDDSQSG